jgi:hypothetical protein
MRKFDAICEKKTDEVTYEIFTSLICKATSLLFEEYHLLGYDAV